MASKDRPGLDEDEASLASIENAINAEGRNNEGNGEAEINMNKYATMKTIAEGLLDIALLASNASQLKIILQTGQEANQFYTLMITLLCISILLQVSIGICLVFIGTLDVNKPKRQKKANTLNNAITIQIILLTVINVLISSFGSMSSNSSSGDDSDPDPDDHANDIHRTTSDTTNVEPKADIV